MFLNRNMKINIKFERKCFFVGMNLKVNLHAFLILLFSILFSFKSFVRAQTDDEIPVLDIPQTEFIICPEESMIMEVSVTGIPPVFIEYSHKGVVDSLNSSDGNVMQIILADTGYYYISQFGDSTHTVKASVEINVDAHPPVGLWLEGGGVFCNYDEPIPIKAHFAGTPPFTLTYLSDNIRYDTTTDQYSVTFSELDNFDIVARIVSDKNCTSEVQQPASISIIQIPQPPIFGDSLVCLYTNSIYTSSHQGYTPQWEIPTGAQSREEIISNGSFVAITWVVPGNHTVNLHLTDLFSGCKSSTTTLSVEVLEQPPIRSSFDTIVCFDFENEMHIELPAQTGDVIFWPELNVYGPSVNLYELGTYSFIQTDMYTCSDTGYITLTEICIPEFHVPEAFTPNGDQLNDMLEIFGVYFNLKFTIYSPSGQELFYSEGNSIYWDGTRNGKDLPNGRYYWYADYTDKYGLPYTKSGYVMLIR
jgi:gliding motility-associated-like protein